MEVFAALEMASRFKMSGIVRFNLSQNRLCASLNDLSNFLDPRLNDG